MSGPTVAQLGIGQEGWLILALLACLTLFFKFSRFSSVRNLDLVLLFVLAPGLLRLVGDGDPAAWTPFVWLFGGSALWLVRCIVDLGLTRRPLLEPNLNAAGLACLSVGLLGMLVAETVSLPLGEESVRNPADPATRPGGNGGPPPGSAGQNAAVRQILSKAPLPEPLRRKPPQVVLARVLAMLAQVGLCAALLAVGWRHFERPIAGLAVVTCYLALPYSRIAVADCGQLVPASLIVTALLVYRRPAAAGGLLGLAAGWMPACLGLLPLWAGFYRRGGAWRFAAAGVASAASCAVLAGTVPGLASWSLALGARSLAAVGLLPGVESPSSASFWTGIDPSYRVPVLIAYLAFVIVASLWPAEKNLGELIALSAALLVASQFWYLEKGGTLILLYLPLILLMMFRPNLATKRPLPRSRGPRATEGAFALHG